MKRAIQILMIASLVVLSACGSRNDINLGSSGIPGITAPSGMDTGVSRALVPNDAVVATGCDTCFGQCSGRFVVASLAFEFCNNNCTANCMNRTTPAQ
jgi:hypothetical protein